MIIFDKVNKLFDNRSMIDEINCKSFEILIYYNIYSLLLNIFCKYFKF